MVYLLEHVRLEVVTDHDPNALFIIQLDPLD
jgi:hypothetical protein